MTFKEIDNLKQLSGFLRINLEELIFFLRNQPVVMHSMQEIMKERDENGVTIIGGIEKFWVSELKIPKKNRALGHRIVYDIINGTLRNLNKTIFYFLNKEYNPIEYVNGFVRGRHIKRNAEVHLNKKIILNIDIKDFFGSIKEEMVVNVFLKLGCKDEIAKSLARLTTLNGNLVQGYYTSPIIANLVSVEMDEELARMAAETDCIYSRYADDICFSSNINIPEIKLVADILEKYGFELNGQKTRVMYRGHKQYVTGLAVSDSRYPRVPRKMKKKIRLLLYYINKYGVRSHLMHVGRLSEEDLRNDFRKQYALDVDSEKLVNHYIRGHIDYINSIEPELAKKLYAQLNQ